MYKIAVSPEQLEAFAGRIEGFKKAVISECEYLQHQADAIRPFVDETTGRALARPVKEIAGIVTEKEDSLKELINNAYAYAGAVRNIRRKIAAEKEHHNTLKEKSSDQHINTPKEKLCGFVNAMQIRDRIASMDSGYQTKSVAKASVIHKRLSTAIDVVEFITGTNIKPLAGCDEDNLESQGRAIGNFLDGQIALNNPQKRIDRSVTVPQEQIDSHTLIIDDVTEPWNNSNK